MANDLILWALVALTLATGLVAGVFLSFSDFVMKSLRAAAPAAGAEAMQVINRKVYKSVFMVLLVGLVPVTVLVALAATFILDATVSLWLVAAGVLYFFGVFVVSAVGNIPMNRQLDGMPQGGVAAQRYWPDYVRGWVVWNHVRTVTSLGAMAAYLVAALVYTASL